MLAASSVIALPPDYVLAGGDVAEMQQVQGAYPYPCLDDHLEPDMQLEAAPEVHHTPAVHRKHGHKKHRREGGGHTRPHTKKGAWSEEEEMTLAVHHREVGNKWAAISKFLPLRSDNDVKNHWNSTLRSKSAVKHTTFLWLYAKEVESVADCEEARCRSFDTAQRMYEELKAHLQLQQLLLDEDEGVPLGDAADGMAPSSLEAGGMPAAALPGGLLPKQEEPVLQAAVGVVMEAPPAPGVMQGHAGSTPRSMPNSPMKPATGWEGAHGAAAALVEAETEDSQCLSAEHMAVPQPLSSKGACYASSSLPEQCDQPTAPGLQVASPRSTAPSAAAAELARAVSGPRVLPRGTWAGASSVRGGLMFGPREGEGQREEEEEEDGEGLLLEMPRASPAPWSLHELSDDLLSMQLPSMQQQQQQQQEACSAARASCEGAAVAHAKLQLADLHLAMQPQLHAPRTPGGVPQPAAVLRAHSQSLHSGVGMQRDPSGSPTNSLAGVPASWGLGGGSQADTTLAGHDGLQPAGFRAAGGMRSTASGSFRAASGGFHSGCNSGFNVSGDAPSPSPPPPAVTPSLQASRWLMSAGDNADGSGLPPGLSGEVIAQDLQDHTFDGLDVNTFLCMRARAHARHADQGAHTSPRSDDGGSGRGTAGNADWGVVLGPNSRDEAVAYGPCSMDVDGAMQQLGSGECGGASPQDVAMQQHSLQQLQQQQQQQQGVDVVMHEGGTQEGEEEEEALRCRLLLSATPDAACSPPGLLQSDPLMLYGMPACNAAVPAAFQVQHAGAAGAGAAAGDEPASSRSRNSCSAAATPFHPLAAWSPFASGAQATGEAAAGQQNTVALAAAARRGSSNSCSSGMIPGAAFAWPKPTPLQRTPRAATSPAAAAAAAGAALAKYASCTAGCDDTSLAPIGPASRSMLRATASMTERLAQQLQLQQLQVQKLAEDAAAWADAAERLCKPAPAAAPAAVPALTKRAEPGACGSSSSLVVQAGAAGAAAGSGSAGPSRNGSSSPAPTTTRLAWEAAGHTAPTAQQACAAADLSAVLRDAAGAGMHADGRQQQVLKAEGPSSWTTFNPLQRRSMPGERSQYAIKEEEPADCLLPGAVAPAAAAAADNDDGGADMGMWANMACTSPSTRRGSRVLSFAQLGTGALSQLGVDGLHSVTTGVSGPLCGGKRKSDGHLATCADFGGAVDDAADGRPAVRTCTPRGPRSTPGCVYPTSGRRSFDTAFMASNRASAPRPHASSPTQAMRRAGSFAPAASSFGPASWCIHEQQEEPLAASHPLVTSGFGSLAPHSSLSPRASTGVLAADQFAAGLPVSRASLDGSTPAGGFGRSPRMGGMSGSTRVIIHQPPAWY